MHFNYLNSAANGEFLDLYLKSLFKKIPFTNSPVLKEKGKVKLHIEIYLWNVWNVCCRNVSNSDFHPQTHAETHLDTRFVVFKMTNNHFSK